jgi:hypothetical protein
MVKHIWIVKNMAKKPNCIWYHLLTTKYYVLWLEDKTCSAGIDKLEQEGNLRDNLRHEHRNTEDSQ